MVACSEQQVIKWTIEAGDPIDQLMRIQIEPHADLRAAPRRLYRGKRRVDIIEIVDQWYGPGYRYVKVKAHDNSVYILRFDEVDDRWELIMFCGSARRRAGNASIMTWLVRPVSSMNREPVTKSQEAYQSGPYTPIMGPSGRKVVFRPSTGE